MAVNYYITSQSGFDLLNYKLKFQRQQFMTQIDGELQIIGDFKLPVDALQLTLTLPSQKLENQVLMESNKSCYSYHLVRDHCRIYKFSSWLNWSKDVFLRSNLTKALVPIQINLDINSERIKNIAWKESNFNNLAYEKFLKKIRETIIKNNFYYTNNYQVQHFKNHVFTSEQQIDLITDWTLFKNLPTDYSHHTVIINSPNMLNRQGQPIKQLLTIKPLKQINFNVTNLNTNFETFLMSTKEIQKQTLSYEHHQIKYDINQKYDISYQAGTFMNNNHLIFAKNAPVQGFFVPKKSQGTISAEIGIKVDQATFLINWSNAFSFNQNYLFNQTDSIEYQVTKIIKETTPNLGQMQFLEFNSWE